MSSNETFNLSSVCSGGSDMNDSVDGSDQAHGLCGVADDEDDMTSKVGSPWN